MNGNPYQISRPDELLHDAGVALAKRDLKAARSLLKMIIHYRLFFYSHCMVNERYDEFGDLLYKALLLELDQEETESIETAELAYVGISQAINAPHRDAPFELYKRRLLLLHYFADYFTDAVIEIFLKKYRQEHMLEARNMALDCLGKMQLADLIHMERQDLQRVERDEQICEACNTMGSMRELNTEELKEAGVMHQALFAFLHVKYK